jgi:predicted phage terminase large subunit-like protein
VVPTRVNDADDSVLLVIMQRVHQKDVSGLIISKELGYDHLCIPMNFERESEIRSRTYLNFVDPREDEGQLAWPERFSADAVKTLKKTLSATGGDYAVSGQLQQRPTPRGGGKFKKSWWRFFRTEANDTFGDVAPRPAGCWDGPAVPLPSDFDTAFVSSDCGFRDNTNNSRVSHLVLGFDGPYCFVLDNVTEHQDFLQTVECIATVDPVTENLTGGLLHKWKDIVDGALVEGKANGDAVVNTLSRNIAGIITIDPEGGKQSRANAIVLPVRSGHVLLPDGAPWLDDFVDELANFPVGTHDDQVDALSQGIIYTIENQDELTALWMSKL